MFHADEWFIFCIVKGITTVELGKLGILEITKGCINNIVNLAVVVAVEEEAASTEDSSEKMVVSVSAGDLILFESDQDENSK